MSRWRRQNLGDGVVFIPPFVWRHKPPQAKATDCCQSTCMKCMTFDPDQRAGGRR